MARFNVYRHGIATKPAIEADYLVIEPGGSTVYLTSEGGANGVETVAVIALTEGVAIIREGNDYL